MTGEKLEAWMLRAVIRMRLRRLDAALRALRRAECPESSLQQPAS